MSDKIIINAIEKIYFTIITFLLFILLTSTTLFILLQNGLYIKKISISSIHIKQLYIKWDQKIDLSIKELVLEESQDSDTTLNHTKLYSYMSLLKHTLHWFDSITIQKINRGKTNASFEYSEGKGALVELSSPSTSISADIFFKEDILYFKVNKFTDKDKKIYAKAKIFIDTLQKQILTKLDTTIHNDANFTLYASLRDEKIAFKAISHNDIQDVKQLVKLAQLPREIKFWTQDAITLQSLSIDSLHGIIDLNNLQNSIKNIYVRANAKALHYRYNPDLDAIHTEWTELEFKDGILYIYPQNATSYKSKLQKSWLKIDFTQAQELLTLHLLFDGVLDRGIQEILGAYQIQLPFTHRHGLIDTDLTLKINLSTSDVDAEGLFKTKKANIDYLGLNIDLFDTIVTINNSKINIKSMQAKHKDIATANVKMHYDTSNNKGVIDFSFEKIAFENIELIPTPTNLNAQYKFLGLSNEIILEKSQWRVGDQTLMIDAIKAPFDFDKLQLSMPTTYLTLKDLSSALIGGEIDIKNTKADLSLDILTLDYHGVEFSQSTTPLRLYFDENLTISSNETIHFTFNEMQCLLQSPQLSISNKHLLLKKTQLHIDESISTKLSLEHSWAHKKTNIALSDFLIKDPKKSNLYYQKKNLLFSLEEKENAIKLESKDIEARALFNNENDWSIHLDSLAQIAKDSDFLNSYHLDNGVLNIYKNSSLQGVGFRSKFVYPYSVLTDQKIPIYEYKINGEFQNETLSLNINDKTDIKIDDTVQIHTSNTGINLDGIIKLIKSLKDDESKNSKKIEFEAENSFIYLSEFRKIISHSIRLNYDKEILTAQLYHDEGFASLRSEKDVFHIYGKDFSDIFMQELFYLSRFKGGVLDFSISGSPSQYNGVVYIKDSTIIDYKILNNILAFINTVPSLVTFSLPGYSRNGVYAKEAYLKFNAKENIFDLTDIFLESKELSILGNGKLNTEKDTIDINLNLKTDLGSNASKIPLVGHILFNKESVSTSLQITGKLSDPTVKSLLAQEIIVAPLNIIKRTLSLPYSILKDLQKRDKNK